MLQPTSEKSSSLVVYCGVRHCACPSQGRLGPGTCTIGELQQLARVLHVSEDELFAVVRAESAQGPPPAE